VSQVRRAVREEMRQGCDQVKIMMSGGVASPYDPLDSLQFSMDEIIAAVEEAHAFGRYVCAHAYTPDKIFDRFRHQVETTYPHRIKTPTKGKLTRTNLRRGLILGFNIVLRVGILSDYRRPFWQAAGHALRRGQIEAVFNMGFVAHHLIRFTREALRGEHNASFYAAKAEQREAERNRPWWQAARRFLPT